MNRWWFVHLTFNVHMPYWFSKRLCTWFVSQLLSYIPNATSGVDVPLNSTEMWRVVIGNDIFAQDWFMQNQYNEKHELLVGQTTYMAVPWYLYPLMVVYHIPANYITKDDHLVMDKLSLIALFSGEMISWDDSHLNLLNPWLADRYVSLF